ncbi:MAG: SlyX family protein [Nitrospirae bacterium]|nr:SlyX family protein [Nitrospirota bacterium]
MEREWMNEDRLTDIETKMAFQENTIKDLSDTVYDQQKQIDALKETLKRLIDQIMGPSIMSPGRNLKDERPPHY